MAKYRVKVIALLLKDNTIAKSGDFVDGKLLPDEKGALKGKYVELVKDKKADADAKAKAKADDK